MRWADADEDDDEVDTTSPQPGEKATPMFETRADEKGIKMVIDYKERDGKTYKVTRRIRQTKITTWTNEQITSRKDMKKFGKPAQNDIATEKSLVIKSEEEIRIEVSKQKAVNVTVKDEAEDKFYEESLAIAGSMNTTKKSWTEMNRSKQVGRDEAGAERPSEPDKPSDPTPAAAGGKDGIRAYVPPSLRGKEQGADGKAKGKGNDGQENAVRIFNLSEDAKEGDLQDLFGSVGRIQRTYLAKDQETGLSRGFAFITYYTREDALKAIAKLDGFGYDNLVLRVAFAKPRV